MELPQKLLNIVHYFSKLPGIGEKTALRHALYLSRLPSQDLEEFADALKNLSDLRSCDSCGMLSDEELCPICQDPNRKEAKSLCIVENFVDCLAIERSGQYRGLFHVLGGVLNPLMGVGPDELKIDRLIERVREEDFQEVIMAINPSVEGDATCSYIKNNLSPNISIERIGFGIPMGGSLEYLDSMTITKALENRRKM